MSAAKLQRSSLISEIDSKQNVKNMLLLPPPPITSFHLSCSTPPVTSAPTSAFPFLNPVETGEC